MIINITYENETLGFLQFSAVLNIHEYFKEILCSRNAVVFSMLCFVTPGDYVVVIM